MNAHQPKVAALLALEEGALSEAGRHRLLRHLDGCALCRNTQESMRDYARVSGEIRALDPPAMDWERLMPDAPSHSDAGPRRVRGPASRAGDGYRWALAAVILLSVVGAGGWLMRLWGGDHAPVATRPAEPPSVALNEPEVPAADAPAATWVLLASDRVRARQADGSEGATGPLARMPEGTRVQLWAGARMDLATEGGASLSLRGLAQTASTRPTDEADDQADDQAAEPFGAELVLERLRLRHTRLQLLRGELSQQVPSLAAGERYEVVTAAHRVSVRGTHFTVESDGHGTRVQLFEGTVDVFDRNDRRITQLTAPSSWQAGMHADDPPAGVTEVSAQAAANHAPLQWRPVDDAVALTLPTLARVREWQFEHTRVSAELPFRAGVARDTDQLLATLVDGRIVPVPLAATAEGLVLTEAALGELSRARRLGRAPGNLTPEQLVPVVERGQPALQRCYERTLRNRPDVSVSVTLRLSLRDNGSVQHAALRGQPAPPAALSKCVERVALMWRFPSPGGPFTFEAPIRFRPVY